MRNRFEGWKSHSCAGRLRSLAVVLALGLPGLVPALAGAVEIDRITVEDPGTGAVKFKVTSDGNVTAASYAGDGAGLANVPHWKGTWNGATAYNKDDCVFYGGSSWIAVQQSTNAQPDQTPASWAILAQLGSQGPAGAQGPQGPAGSSDTQSQIFDKIAAAVDSTVLSIQQGPTEAGSAVKFAVKDNTGAVKFVVQSNGAVGMGTSSPVYPVTFDTSIATNVPPGIGTMNIVGSNNRERIEIRSYGSYPAPCVQGKGAQIINGVPTSTLAGQSLFVAGGSGYDNYGNEIIALKGLFAVIAEENFTSTNQGTYMTFHTTPAGSTTRTEKLRIAGNGNIGVGTSSPTQKLEVNGGVRINTTSARPACSNVIRSTFWVTQGGDGVKDGVEVCLKDAAGAYAWRTIW